MELRRSNPEMFGDYYSDEEAVDYKSSPKITDKKKKKAKKSFKAVEVERDLDL
jgi:hypothetical protein